MALASEETNDEVSCELEQNPASDKEVPVSLFAVATSIWFMRSLMLVAGIIVGSLLLAYDVIFVDTFLTLGNTTSYFPWAWGVLYTDPGTVQTLFLIVVTVSLSIMAGCAVALNVTVPELKQELVLRK